MSSEHNEIASSIFDFDKLSLAVNIDSSNTNKMFEQLCLHLIEINKDVACLKHDIMKKMSIEDFQQEIINVKKESSENCAKIDSVTKSLNDVQTLFDTYFKKSFDDIFRALGKSDLELPKLEIFDAKTEILKNLETIPPSHTVPSISQSIEEVRAPYTNKEIQQCSKQGFLGGSHKRTVQSTTLDPQSAFEMHANETGNERFNDISKSLSIYQSEIQRIWSRIDNIQDKYEGMLMRCDDRIDKISEILRMQASEKDDAQHIIQTPLSKSEMKSQVSKAIYPGSSSADVQSDHSHNVNGVESEYLQNLHQQFIEATRLEIDVSYRKTHEHFNKNLQKIKEDLDIKLRKVVEANNDETLRIINNVSDLQEKFTLRVNELQKTHDDHTNKIHESEVDIKNRIFSLEKRIQLLTESSELGALITRVEVKDSVFDFGPLLKQLGVMYKLVTDFGARIDILERKEFTSPEIFNSLVERVKKDENRSHNHDQQLVHQEIKIGQLMDMVSVLKKLADSKTEEQKLDQIRENVVSLDETTAGLKYEIQQLKETMNDHRNRFSDLKDSHSPIVDIVPELTAKIGQLFEVSRNQENKIKNVILMVQNGNAEMSGNIKDIESRSQNNNKDFGIGKSKSKRSSQVCDTEEPLLSPQFLSETKSQHPVQVDNDSTNLSVQSLKQPVEHIDTVTSPHSTLNSPVLPELLSQLDKTKAKREKVPLSKPKSQRLLRSHKPVSRVDSKALNELSARLVTYDQSFSSIKSAIDAINKHVKSLQDQKAEKGTFQQLFEQFKHAISELNGKFGVLKKQLALKVDKSELENMKGEIIKQVIGKGDTAAGTSECIRCLLCGKLRKKIANIDESHVVPHGTTVAYTTGLSGPNMINVSAAMKSQDGTQKCFVYSETGQMFYGEHNIQNRIAPNVRTTDAKGDM